MTALQAYLQNPRTRKVLSKKPGSAGFSLIELVVVVAVLAILSAIAIPAFTNISEKARAAAASNTVATIVKECAVKLNDGGGTYNPPTLEGYRTLATSGWFASSLVAIQGRTQVGAVGDDDFVAGVAAVPVGGLTKPTAPATCIAAGEYRLVSDDIAKYPTFRYNTADGTKSCIVTPGSAAVNRGCPVNGGSW